MKKIRKISTILVCMIMLAAGFAAVVQMIPESTASPSTDEDTLISDLLIVSPISVSVVSVPNYLGVGQSATLQASTSPSILLTGGDLEWKVLGGGRGIFTPSNSETPLFTLLHPSESNHFLDVAATDIEVTYKALGYTVTARASIHLDEENFVLPYISGYKAEVVGKSGAPFAEPGDIMTISPQHKLPADFVLVDENMTSDPPIITLDTEGILPVTLNFSATYQDPGGQIITDSMSKGAGFPFSYDTDLNGRPDIIDTLLATTKDIFDAETSRNPDPDDPNRLASLIGALVVDPPIYTYDPTVTDAYGYYIVSTDFIEFCPAAFTSLKEFIITLVHENKHRFLHHLNPFLYTLLFILFGNTFDHDLIEAEDRILSDVLDIILDILEDLFPFLPLTYEFELPTPTDRSTFNVQQGSTVTVELTIVNENQEHALENLDFDLEFIETSGGMQLEKPEPISGGFITAGPNGIAETSSTGDDYQVTPVNQGWSGALIIEPGPNAILDSIPTGDDTLLSTKHIHAGPNGIAETVAIGDDVQCIPFGQGSPHTPVVHAGLNGVLVTIPEGDDEIQPTPTTFITDLTPVLVPSIIPPGEETIATFSFEVPPEISSQSEFALINFLMTANKGNGGLTISYPLHLFITPEPDEPVKAQGFEALEFEVNPETLNLKSNGRWVSGVIELPQGYDISDIDLSTIYLEEVIPAEYPVLSGHSLKVKFDRSDLVGILKANNEIILEVTCEINDGTIFQGQDTIRVINPP